MERLAMASGGENSEVTGLTHECGVFGCIATGDWPTQIDVAQVVCLGLVALQHRGQESAGIVTTMGEERGRFYVHKGMGMINNVFNDDAVRKLKGVGHTRYSTSAASEEVNCQPFVVHTEHGPLAVAHNGELVNCSALRRWVLARGVGLSTLSDSELITQALCLNPPGGEQDGQSDWPARIEHFMQLAPLSYSLVIMFGDKIYGVRDPYGNRPLCIGKIMPVKNLHISIVKRPDNKPQAFCIFEYVYFARSDSIFEGQMVYSVRMQCGKMLAKETFIDADLSGIPFGEVLCKNRYVGRTFIQPSTRLRQLGVAKKFGALSENVKDKRLILIDDSIVRGNTIGPIIKLLRDAGAKEVHVRIASPPLQHPCYMGINIPTSEELIANKLSPILLAKHVGADSLSYLSVDGLVQAVRHRIADKENPAIGHCTACLTGEYPEKLQW
ncbi:hypothetical protein B566_EDAN011910 [Ephemera danica]|nr:hypothetical protein B566_EDAN011910 [Ephemera danica]